jgi:hypothetical protein
MPFVEHRPDIKLRNLAVGVSALAISGVFGPSCLAEKSSDTGANGSPIPPIDDQKVEERYTLPRPDSTFLAQVRNAKESIPDRTYQIREGSTLPTLTLELANAYDSRWGALEAGQVADVLSDASSRRFGLLDRDTASNLFKALGTPKDDASKIICAGIQADLGQPGAIHFYRDPIDSLIDAAGFTQADDAHKLKSAPLYYWYFPGTLSFGGANSVMTDAGEALVPTAEWNNSRKAHNYLLNTEAAEESYRDFQKLPANQKSRIAAELTQTLSNVDPIPRPLTEAEKHDRNDEITYRLNVLVAESSAVKKPDLY